MDEVAGDKPAPFRPSPAVALASAERLPYSSLGGRWHASLKQPTAPRADDAYRSHREYGADVVRGAPFPVLIRSSHFPVCVTVCARGAVPAQCTR
jgi:hypothetical protein